MEELDKIRRDINCLVKTIQCLDSKTYAATIWSLNHTLATGYQYTPGVYVWHGGSIYECIFPNDSAVVTDTTFWRSLGKGHLLHQEQADWDATEGPSFIRNKPTIVSDVNFVFRQGLPLAIWVIPHMLNKYPSVSIFDNTGTSIEAEVVYNSLNVVTITFSSAVSGTASLN